MEVCRCSVKKGDREGGRQAGREEGGRNGESKVCRYLCMKGGREIGREGMDRCPLGETEVTDGTARWLRDGWMAGGQTYGDALIEAYACYKTEPVVDVMLALFKYIDHKYIFFDHKKSVFRGVDSILFI